MRKQRRKSGLKTQLPLRARRIENSKQPQNRSSVVKALGIYL